MTVTHWATRGSDVEAFIKAARDTWTEKGFIGHGGMPIKPPQWYALDELLDDYRLHADAGTPLGQHACEGPNCGCTETDEAQEAPSR